MSGQNPEMLIRIAADLQELKKNLTEGKAQIETTTAAMGKLASSLDGSKLEQRAHNIVAAINQVQGATKLTDAEAARHLKTLDAWIDKGQRIGREIPPHILATRDALVRAEEPANKLMTAFSSLNTAAATLGIGLSVGVLVGFGKSVFDTASNIHDMAEKLGISAEATQGFKFAAEQAGSTLDAVGTAITKMNKNLVGGDKPIVAALGEVGLNLADIRAMKPEDAFLAIADAIQKMPDPMVQSHAALTIFGKSAADLLPAIKEGFRDAANSADKMSNDTVNDLEAAQDAWGKLSNKVTIYSGKLIADTMRVLDVWSRMKEDGANQGFGAVAAPTVKPPSGSMFSASTLPELHDTDEAIKLMNEGFKEQYEAAKKAAAAVQQHADAIQRLREQLSGQGAIKAANDMLEALRGTVPVQKMTRAEQDAINKTLGAALDTYRALGKVAPEAMRLIWMETMKGPAITAGLGAEWKGLGEQIKIVVPETKAWVEIISGLPKDTFKVLGDSIKPVPPVVKRVTDELSILSQGFAQMGQIAGGSLGLILSGIGLMVSQLETASRMTRQIGGAASNTSGKEIGGNFGAGSVMFSSLASDAQKSAAAIQASAAIVQGAMNVWASSANDASKAAGAFHGAMSGAQAGAAFGPYGAAVGAAAGAIMGMIHTLTAGRRAVEDFAKSFDTIAAGSGFDELHAKLLKLDDAGEQLWIKLTQKTKKGDKAAAQGVIDEITTALAKQDDIRAAVSAAGYQSQSDLQGVADKAKAVYDYMVKTGGYTAAQLADAFQKSADAQDAALGKVGEAHKTATDAIKAMTDQIDSLSQSIANEAPEEVMGVIEQQTRAQIDAIKKQRDEAQLAIDSTASDAAKAAEGAAKAIDDTLAAHDFVVKLRFDMSGMPTGGTAPGPYPQADGGDYMVTRPTLFLAGEAGPERATFTPQGRSGVSKTLLPVQINMSGKELWRGLLEVAHAEGLV